LPGHWFAGNALQQLAVGFGIAGAAYSVIHQKRGATSISLERVIVSLVSASSIPAGLLLLACAFDNDLISSLHDVGLYLAAAGIALLFVSIKELFK